jgi:hypothetical protein
MYLSTHAYKLFSEGKTPEEVAIELNLRQTQVTEILYGTLEPEGIVHARSDL